MFNVTYIHNDSAFAKGKSRDIVNVLHRPIHKQHFMSLHHWFAQILWYINNGLHDTMGS